MDSESSTNTTGASRPENQAFSENEMTMMCEYMALAMKKNSQQVCFFVPKYCPPSKYKFK